MPNNEILRDYFLLKKYSISDEYYCGFYDIFFYIAWLIDLDKDKIANLDRE
jgi:hypothetical protein